MALTPAQREAIQQEAIALWLGGMSHKQICEELNARHDTAYYPAQITAWFSRYRTLRGANGEDPREVVQSKRRKRLEKMVENTLVEMDRRHLKELRDVQRVALGALTATGEGAAEFKDKRQAGDVYLGALREERHIVAPQGQSLEDGQLIVQINLGDGQIQQAVMPITEPPVTRRRTGLTSRQRAHQELAAEAAPAALPEGSQG